MITVENFEQAPLSRRYYGGSAGRKIGIHWNNDNWLLKFPKNTRDLQGSVPSYSTAPLSEYLGSHVYASLNIDVHDTVLGIRDGKLVCACRDFVKDGYTLYDFRNLKNSVNDELTGFSQDASDGMSVVLPDVIAAIAHIDVFKDIPNVLERFWDMFVTDAFIRNIDRNNTNWGVLISDTAMKLAPVFANSNSFNNKRTPHAISQRLHDTDLLRQDALDVHSCFVSTQGKPIAPLKYIASGQDPDCNAALQRFIKHLDMHTIIDMFYNIPDTVRGVDIIDEDYRQYHLALLQYRVEHVLLPTYQRLQAAQ
ncbi:hypothetical protein GCM10007377_14730 [Galliscardovia ingluviei]|uniref:HipA-like C-terminal domain-containing protein n=1 Tax=Galliscardovia ingluviei TaxID=1769422 RepID=A0A8J3AKG7_9BIFI|nr:CtkA family protein [Galliscardovia ingluviei]GGI15203.1 hypothetical protein GCM10007377_14730 [Galliscardovia ingluviei]